MEIYLGLPAYNEEASIKPLFTRVESLKNKIAEKIHVIVYDDGCVDNTRTEVKAWETRLSIIYLDGQVNKGLGAGMSALMAEFANRANSDDVLVVMDCDDTHDPDQISSMLEVFATKPVTDVVIASRYRLGATISGVPFYRVVLSIGAAMLYKLVHPIWRVRDYTCGYRAYRPAVVKRAFEKYGTPLLKERGFACMVELLLKVARVGANVREIPLALAYDNKLSASKMDVSGNAFRLLKKLITWRVKGLV
ncbi:MAG TPA: glycosyltransferase [Candidatus Paceibacterota bacterium]|nr:glycosyltransferase [Candidatus Paceibacterota bacterium]